MNFILKERTHFTWVIKKGERSFEREKKYERLFFGNKETRRKGKNVNERGNENERGGREVILYLRGEMSIL